MTKFNLRTSFTRRIFETYAEEDSFEKLLKAISPDQLSIFRDPEKLEELFLTLNIHKLKNKQFRKKLLDGAFGTQRFNNYVSKIGLKNISRTSTESQKQKFIEKIAKFDWKNNEQTHSFVNSFELDEGSIPSSGMRKILN